jgi:hypothetical protein
MMDTHRCEAVFYTSSFIFTQNAQSIVALQLHIFVLPSREDQSMIRSGESACPNCGGELKYYDSVPRILRTKRRDTSWIKLRRMRCVNCKCLHRELPEFIFPYKQYESEVIFGVLEGFISPNTLGFEDYPCELTMLTWIATLR